MNWEQVQFEASDPGLFIERMEPMSPHISVSALRKGRFGGRVDAVLLPSVGLARTFCYNFRVESDAGRGYYSVTLPLSSSYEVVKSQQAQSFSSDAAHVLWDDEAFDLRSNDATVLIANFQAAYLRNVASKLQSFPRGHSDQIDLTTPSARALQRQAMRLWSDVQRAGPISRSPLALQEAADSLTAKFLMAMTDADSGDCEQTERESTRARISRAENWISAHLSEPISRADLCTVSGLNARTLSRGFRRRHDMGPMAFVRERRLDQVHRMLLAAVPGEVTVSEVALDYGFHHLSRFAADYHRTFGELPSETLST